MDMEDCPGERKDADGNQEGSDDSLLPALPDEIYMQFLARISRSDYGSLSSVNRQFELLLHSGYLYCQRRQLGNIEHWIYLECNLFDWEAFDPKRNRWKRLPRIPSEECFHCSEKECLAVGTELLVFGQEISGFVIWRYSILTHNWFKISPMASPRCRFGSSSSGEVAIVAGGCDKNGVVLKSAELYNSELRSWEILPEMHSPRKLCCGFFMDGKFYVIGGKNSNGEYLTCGEEFNLQTRTWRRIPNMFPAGNAHAPPLVAVVNNELYAVEHSRNEVKKYSKESNSWKDLVRLPLPADTANGSGLAFRACGDKLVVIKGQITQDYTSIYLYSWPPGSDGRQQWERAVKKHAGFFVYNCAVMGC